jgi:hypothetical protein
MKVFNIMGAATTAIDHYLRGEPAGLNLGAIAKIRTAAQHRILSLPPSFELQDASGLSPHTYEACRTCALIYGIAVIFPVSNVYNLVQNLASRLQESLMYLDVESCELSLSALYLWILVLGGIAASDGPERTFFVVHLESIVMKYQICEWSGVEEILQKFLWLESACGPGGRALWAEVMKSTPRWRSTAVHT